MPDRYEIRRRKDTEFRWELHRTDDDEDFGFTKFVGLFRRGKDLNKALRSIRAHSDMNFAEWFFTQIMVRENDLLEEDVMERHYYKLWKTLGGHLTVDAKRKMMGDIALMQCYVMARYEDRIEDIEEAWACEQAGDSW